MSEDVIPDAAHVSSPRSIALVALLHAYRGRAPMAELARHGVAAAKAAGAPERASLIQRVGAQGVLALRADAVQRPLLAAAGPVAGGALTAQDLEAAVPGDVEATSTPVDGGSVHSPPWAPASDQRTRALGVVTGDERGLLVVLTYCPPERGVTVPELEIVLPEGATPVRRGVTRTPAGTPIPAPAPIAVASHATTAIAIALEARATIRPSDLARLLGPAPMRSTLADLATQTAGTPLAILWNGREATPL